MVNLSKAFPKALFLAAALFSLAAFFSCDNSSDSSGYSPSQEQAASPASPAAPAGGEAAAPEIQCITFRGSVRTGGALPASYAKALEGLGFGGTEEGVEGLSKSARPDVTADGTSIEHFAVATPNVGEPVEGTFASPSSTTFEMPLAIGKTWNIVCGIRNVSGDKKIIMSDSFQMEVTVSNSVLSHVFTLTPYTETVEGVAPIGNVALTVNHSGNALSVSASWEDPAGLPALTVESPAASPSCITASGVPVGNHRLAIFFRDSNGVSVYESVQVVTVLNGLTTETWMPESGEAAISSSGHFAVDNDVIQGAASDRIYVGIPAALKENPSVTASNSNSGSAYSPLENLQAAFNKIQSAGSGSKDFKIFVSGEVEGTATLDAVRDTHARSVTIEGLDGPDESLKPKSVLNGLKEGSVVTIASNVPVTIKNLQITNGRSSEGGGGISMSSGAKVTLGQGALIGKPTDQAIMDYDNCGNSGNKGGGILVNGASLVLESGSSVQGNYGSGGLEVGSGGGGISVINGGSLVIGEGAEVCKNASSGPGGGIFVGDNSSVTVNGGIVNQNKASNYGGGFYLDAAEAAAPARLELKSGQINQNAAIGKQYIGLAKGGGIYASKNGQIQIKGGQINNNSAGKETTSPSGHTYGAGVYIHASTAQMTNGEISENEGYAVRDMDRHCGSAVAVMEDAEFSISGGTISKNKIAKGEKLGAIYVKSEKKTVEGSPAVVQGTFKISGSASIPYDSGDNAQNYVYLEAEDSRSGISEQAKERIYSPIKVGNLTGGSVAASVCAQNWLRGKQVLSADGVTDLTPLKDKLSFTEAGISFAVPTADVTKANLMSPFYVSDTGGSDDASCPGTYDRPYKTFAYAIGEIVNTNAAADYTIRIKGNVSGAQAVVADTITSANCTGLTIEGTTALGDSGLPADSLDRGLFSGNAQNDGNALVIDTDVPVTIQNLKITGGKITRDADPGAGVSVKKSGADVRLGNGAQVVGNGGASESNGGGVYVASGARLFMYGKSLIGDLTETTATQPSAAGSANYVYGNGGGIYNLGSVYIGYERLVSGNPIQRDMAEGFGVRRNCSGASNSGGGIYNGGSGTVLLNSGSVSYNKSAGIAVGGGNLYIKGGEICANTNSFGAGVYLSDGSAEMSGGTIGGSEAKANSATNGGGAVYVNFNKTFKMTGGTISCNKQTGSVGGGGGGGAVYLMMSSGATSTYGTFEMTGGVLENNSAASGHGGAVFNQGILKLSGKASIPYAEGKNDVYLYGTRRITANSFDASAPETVATITMPAENWKRGRVVLDGSVNDEIASKFKTIDPDFNITAKSSTEGTIDADIVVADGGKTGGDAAGARGTYSDPYGSVEAAIAYGIDASHTAITIKGSVGKQEVSSWPSSGGAAGVDSITLKGKDSTAKINAGGATDAGSALTVDASGKTVTIQDLTITGGNATNGGGINIAAGTVKLVDGAKVTGNLASANGGGVYVGSSGTLFMCGSSLIGDSSDSTTIAQDGTAPGASSFANKAKFGGGIYNDGALYIGYSGMSGTNPEKSAMTVTANSTAGYGIRRNLAESGAGVYQNSSTDVQVASGKISYNMATESGGAFYIAKKDSTTRTKVTFVQNSTAAMDSNKAAVSGGAVHIAGAFTIFSGNGHNNVAPQGGAIYLGQELNFGPYANFYDANNAKGVNDIYLEKSIWLSGKSNGGDVVASITMPDDKWIRGKGVLQSAEATYTAASAGKFKATDSDFTVVQKNSTSTMAVLSADIYVAGTASTRKHCLSTATPTDSATTRGTASSPFASIKGAMYAVNADATTITVDGTLSDAQTIDGKRLDDSSIPTAVTAITIKGYKASSTATSSGMLDGGSNSSNKTMLTVNKSGLAVTIQDLTITRGNAANGGGIKLAAGTVNLESGAKVSFNKATSGGSGAGVYVASGATLNIKTGSEIYSNAAYSGTINGGGVYNGGTTTTSGGQIYNNSANNGGGVYNSGTLTMSAGTIGEDGALNTAETSGGAIYQNGTFNISASAYVYPGSEKTNDVYLPSNKKVTIDSAWSGSQASNKMTLTPSTWARGSQVLAGTKAAYYYTYFNTSDSEWSVGYKESSWTLTDDLKTRIGADIYVAGSENRASGISAPSETASERIGTKLKPFNSIEEGVKACWNTTLPFTVKFSGTITETAQTIPAGSTSTGGLASAITIEGVQGNTKDIINRNLSTATDSGTALTINTATPVTIKKIKITGGYNKNASGGGIRANVAGASLTLSQGALVTANNLSVNDTIYSGGGVYVEGTSTSPATLIMESDATISGNDSNQGKGGGVGLKYATLCMIGNALIGDKDATSAATGDSGKHSNSAQSGGGVYVGSGSKLRLGYATPTATTGTPLDAAYGIRYNYVYNVGGGVLVAAGSSVEIASGSISCNGTIANATYKNGGGIYLNETATLTMTGGTIAKNKAYDGGGVYLYGNTSTGSSIVMSGGTIGDSQKNKSPLDQTTIDYSNYAVSYGGGIYSASGSSVSISGGYVNYNWGDRGGGVYSSGSFAMTDGNISYNATNTGNGGGVYFDADATLTSGTLQGNKSHNGGAIYIQSGKTVTINGALALTSNGSVLRGNSNTQGGAIYNGGTLNITGAATFADNSANGSTSGNAYGGAIFNAGGLTISAGASINNNSATASGSGKKAYGGAIYNYGTLTMSAGSVGTTTMNTVTSSGTSGDARGGAIYQGGSFIVSGSINLYNSSNAATKNDVYLPDSEKRVVLNGKLTNSNTTVMKLTPNSYTFGAYVVEKGGSINESNFKSSLEKIGLIPSGIYSGVAYSSNNYSAGATTWTGYRGVVGIDFNSITENQIKSYTFDSVQQDYAGGVHYILLKNSSGKYGAIEFNVARTNASNGTITAKYVVFNSSRETGNLTGVTYQTGSYMMMQALTNWKPFGNDDSATLMWDGTSIVMYVATSYNNMTGHWLY